LLCCAIIIPWKTGIWKLLLNQCSPLEKKKLHTCKGILHLIITNYTVEKRYLTPEKVWRIGTRCSCLFTWMRSDNWRCSYWSRAWVNAQEDKRGSFLSIMTTVFMLISMQMCLDASLISERVKQHIEFDSVSCVQSFATCHFYQTPLRLLLACGLFFRRIEDYIHEVEGINTFGQINTSILGVGRYI